MSEPKRRKGETFEGFAERLIREAQEEGAFEGLPRGKPLPLTGGPPPEGWWAKEKLRREKLSDLPDALAILHEAERTIAEALRETDERIVRERLQALDARIRRLNATHVAGPPTTLAPLDVERILARWREGRGLCPGRPGAGDPP